MQRSASQGEGRLLGIGIGVVSSPALPDADAADLPLSYRAGAIDPGADTVLPPHKEPQSVQFGRAGKARGSRQMLSSNGGVR